MVQLRESGSVSAGPDSHSFFASLCDLCVLCVSVVRYFLKKNNHRDTENAEVARRRSQCISRSRLRTVSTSGRDKQQMKVIHTFLVMMITVAAAVVSHAQTTAVNLDPTFGTGGTVRTDFAGNIDQANAVAIQPNGQIVAAGSSFSNSRQVEDFIVARYNANGSLDKRFGKNGKITTDFFRNVDSISAIAIQPDGRIIVAGFAQLGGNGSTPRVFALARYRNDGIPDTSFGNGGALTTSFGGNFAAASAVMLQPDGKIVVAGTVDFNPDLPGSGLDFALARYNASGTLDGSFGKGGKVVFDFFGSFDQANAAVLQPDGKIIVAGSASYDSFNRDIGFALTR